MLRRTNKANLITLIFMTLLITTFTSIKATNAAEELHTQLENGESTASVYLDDLDEANGVISELVKIDTESPYDAEMIVSRGTSITIRKYNTGKLELEQINPISIAEANSLLDTMESEIRENLSETPTEKEELSQIIKYIGKTYKYDFLARTDAGTNKNFVDAYNSDRKIICTQYSALTYLLCNRFGIDCKIVSGNDHRFNAIRLNGEDTYTAYDLTKTTFFLPAKVGFVDQITGNYNLEFESSRLSKAIGKALNERIDYHFSLTAEDIVIATLLIAILGTVIVKVRRK